MKGRSVLALLLCALVAPAPGQAPPGYFLGEPVFLPDSTREVLAGGRFQITIQRVAADSFEYKLLALAERLFPDSATINHAAARESAPPVVSRLKAAGTDSGKRWWWDKFDGVWTPYAVTGAAVAYYRQRVYDRAATSNPFTFAQPVPLHNGNFSYRAVVEHLSPAQSGGASFVVRMQLSWDYWCGMRCAVMFGSVRRVYFTAEGRPLRVDGDGKPDLLVS